MRITLKELIEKNFTGYQNWPYLIDNGLRDHSKVIEVELDELPKAYEKWIKQMLKQGHLSRDSIWSADFAVGDETFVKKIFKLLGFPTRLPKQSNAVHEDMASYGDTRWNELEWKIF